MKARFLFDGHEIIFFRGLFYAKLIIDGQDFDRVEGFRQCQMSSFDLNGMLSDGRKVHLHIKLGFPPDTAFLYIDGVLAETRKVI